MLDQLEQVNLIYYFRKKKGTKDNTSPEKSNRLINVYLGCFVSLSVF